MVNVQEIKKYRVLGETDVIVGGSGPAGIGASVGATRKGMKTILVENYGFLGGNWTMGGVHEIHGGIKSNLIREITDELLETGAATAGTFTGHPIRFTPEGMKLALDELVERENIDLLLHTRVVDTIVDSGRTVVGVLVATKRGLSVTMAKCIIDATGDGDIAAYAGAESTLGREEDGCVQAPTLVFQMGNVDVNRNLGAFEQKERIEARNMAHLTERFQKGEPIRVYEFPQNAHRIAMESGATSDELKLFADPMHPNLFHTTPLQGVVVFNMAQMSFVNMIDSDHITRSEVETRDKIAKMVDFMIKYVPGFEKSYLIDSGPNIGIRATRQIHGDYILAEDDITEARRFDDEVCLCNASLDVHHPSGRSAIRQPPKEPGTHFGLPYRCFLPKGYDGLLLAGRCLSATYSAGRGGTTSCNAYGQVAGIAAALSIQSNSSIRDLSVADLQQELRGVGVLA